MNQVQRNPNKINRRLFHINNGKQKAVGNFFKMMKQKKPTIQQRTDKPHTEKKVAFHLVKTERNYHKAEPATL